MLFRRSDGVLFRTTEGSEEYKLMSKDGAFEQVDESAFDTTVAPSDNQSEGGNQQAPSSKKRRNKNS